MKVYGRSSASEFLGDQVVYRNLNVVNPRLPSFTMLRQRVGLPNGSIPRKGESEYAQAMVELLRLARALESPKARLERVIYLGDTRMSDGNAFTSLCQAGEWEGRAFICAETAPPPVLQTLTVSGTGNQLITLANRWAALAEFDQQLTAQCFPIDERTVVVIDLDKTTLGARGRNAHVIDAARVQAVSETVSSYLGNRFDPRSFRESYDRLNQPEFHPFTTDNQDYLAYVCLMLGSGLFDREKLIIDIQTRMLQSFREFIDLVNARVNELPQGLASIHQDIYSNVKVGDLTPFKIFRRKEYFTTISKMGYLPHGSPVSNMLAEEIVLTEEVRRAALDWKTRGALLFGLSDKPDEASLPTDEFVIKGYVPLHRKETHVVGE